MLLTDLETWQLREALANAIRAVGPDSTSAEIIRRELQRRSAVAAGHPSPSAKPPECEGTPHD